MILSRWSVLISAHITLAAALVSAAEAKLDPPLLKAKEFQAVPSASADARYSYGKEAEQFGELRRPNGDAECPVVVLIHGGCWKSEYSGLKDLAPIADALKSAGIASWNVEYRRIGNEGGGWPGTFLDVANAVDFVRTLAPKHRLKLDNVVLLGHSAGGHLALWAASRHKLSSASSLYVSNPLPIAGVMSLAGAGDLISYLRIQQNACRSSVVEDLLGGSPDTVADRYTEGSVNPRLPLGIPQTLVWGMRDNVVPTWIGTEYSEQAQKKGDLVRWVTFPEAGHFEVALPNNDVWPKVLSEIVRLQKSK